MVTMFHMIQFAGAGSGAVVGWWLGTGMAGLVGGAVGAVMGGITGWIIGGLPLAVTFWLLQRSLGRATVAGLRARLDQEYFISHLIIAELVRRGEPVESFRSVVERQLASQSEDVRRFGRANAKLWIADLAGGPATEAKRRRPDLFKPTSGPPLPD